MSYNTYTQQGSFVSTGARKTLLLRGDIDWIHTWNLTTLAAGGAGTGVEFRWMRGFEDDTAIEYTKLAADDSIAIDTIASGGFTPIDSSKTPKLSAINSTVTAVSNASPPLVSLTSTAGLEENDIIRIINVTGAQQLGGIDFTIDTITANTSFELAFAPTIVAGTIGSFRRVIKNPLYYPRHRYISAITQATNAVITLTVTHGFTVGQIVRFQVPAAFDMTEMNNLQGTITAVSAVNNTITVNIDSSGFTAFAWPLTTDVPFTPAMVIPLGDEATVLDGATYNQGYIGVELAAGVDSPAGVLNDDIFWMAGKGFSVNNE